MSNYRCPNQGIVQRKSKESYQGTCDVAALVLQDSKPLSAIGIGELQVSLGWTSTPNEEMFDDGYRKGIANRQVLDVMHV